MGRAASAGDRAAMLYLAEVNYTGHGNNPILSSINGSAECQPDWPTAVHWYEMAAEQAIDSSPSATSPNGTATRNGAKVSYSSVADWPVYRLHGRMAEMYAKGGHGLEPDRNKACEFGCWFHAVSPHTH